MNHQYVASVKKKKKHLRFWDVKLSIWSVLSKLGKKSGSQMFNIDSVSVWTEVCLIIQETKTRISGHQHPVHQEPRGSDLVVETGHMSISWALC